MGLCSSMLMRGVMLRTVGPFRGRFGECVVDGVDVVTRMTMEGHGVTGTMKCTELESLVR